MANSVTLVVTATPNPAESEAMKTYLAGVQPLLAGRGGKLVKRVKTVRKITGDVPAMVLVMDFEDEAAITDLFASQEYSDLIPFRDRGFSSINVLVASDL